MTRKRRPTQVDVARQAGVSPAVVSTVMNGSGRGSIRVGPDTVARVRAAVRELGYVPNPVARNLAGGKNRILGVFTFESIFPIARRNFYYPFLVGIESAAEERGYDLLLFTSASASGVGRRIYRDGVNRLQLTDGAILLGHERDKAEVARLSAEGFPFVFVGRRRLPGAEPSYVAADYAGGTGEIVTYLARLGHRRIAYLGEPGDREALRDRIRGYARAVASLGLETDPALRAGLGPESVTPGRVRAWTDAGVSAFLVENDILARGLVDAAAALGRSAPADFSFAVLGDPLEPSDDPPDWTSFKIPRQEMGRQSLEVLLDLLEEPGRAPLRRTLPCTLVPGGSTGRVRVRG